MGGNTTRRAFLRRSTLGASAVAMLGPACENPPGTGRPQGPTLVDRIEREVIWNGREAGYTWFHPRGCMIAGQGRPTAFLTCQKITGSDYFWPVHFSESTDLGATWSEPEPVPGLGRRQIEAGMEEGVCDVVPEYHSPTGALLAMGHNVYYKDGKLTRPNEGRHPVYVVRAASGAQVLEWDDPRASAIYTSNCGQRYTYPDGDVLVPLSFGPLGRRDRSFTTLRCSFDGRRLSVKSHGNELRCEEGRGLLEPSLTFFHGRFFVTIRAEDGHGYVSRSADGLEWEEKRPWSWDDGEPLTMSTTQQHWLVHSEGLFLVYTRKADENANVMRWRAPLYLAEVDPDELHLVRESEQIVFPLIGDGVNDPDHVARMGNFHVTNATPEQSWVTVGESLPNDGWSGDTLLARVFWNQPNQWL